MNRIRSLSCAVLASICLCACATPPVVIDQATHGVRLTEELTSELIRYQRNTAIAFKRRLVSVQDDESQISLAVENGKLTESLLARAGLGQRASAESLLRQTADDYGRLVEGQEKSRQQLADALTTLIEELPLPSERLGAVQKAMAELGTELSSAERFKIVTGFLTEVKALVDENARKADEAASGQEPVTGTAPATAATQP